MIHTKLMAACLGLILACGLAPAADQGGEFVELIKSDSLDGWHLVNRPKEKPPASKKPNWEVSDGVLTNTGPGRHLATDEKYRDFELEFEFQVPAKCNSGLYLRGRYELKLKDADPLQKPSQSSGAVRSSASSPPRSTRFSARGSGTRAESYCVTTRFRLPSTTRS